MCNVMQGNSLFIFHFPNHSCTHWTLNMFSEHRAVVCHWYINCEIHTCVVNIYKDALLHSTIYSSILIFKIYFLMRLLWESQTYKNAPATISIATIVRRNSILMILKKRGHKLYSNICNTINS